MGGYSRDLSAIHDEGFGEFARKAAPGLLNLLRRNGIEDGLVVDLGCGSGIWARILTDAGYQVLGIDISAPMLELARRQAPGAEFREGSLLEAELPGCRAVTAMGECLNYCFDAENSRGALSRLFRRVWKALEPGGVFVFDVVEPGVLPGGVRRIHGEAEDWAVLVEAHEDRQRRLLSRRITSFRKAGTLFRRNEEIHLLRLYRGEELAADLSRAGFLTRMLSGYGNYRLPRGHRVLAARKPVRLTSARS